MTCLHPGTAAAASGSAPHPQLAGRAARGRARAAPARAAATASAAQGPSHKRRGAQLTGRQAREGPSPKGGGARVGLARQLSAGRRRRKHADWPDGLIGGAH